MMVERSFERRAAANLHAPAGLRLAQLDVRAVIGRPRQAQEVALALAGP